MVRDEPVGLQDVMPTILDGVGLEVPASVTGRSLMPFVRGETPTWRETLHGEHSGGKNRPETAWHFITDGQTKYIWYSQSGREQLFDIAEDPDETKDLAATADLGPWRKRLIERLRDRPEGFTDGSRLVAGRAHEPMVPGTPREGNAAGE